eukprot:4030731-Prymnesium_polylepis.1
MYVEPLAEGCVEAGCCRFGHRCRAYIKSVGFEAGVCLQRQQCGVTHVKSDFAVRVCACDSSSERRLQRGKLKRASFDPTPWELA